MIAKVTTLKYVLLDANVIIEAYELSVWDNLLRQIEIIVPSIVAREETLFFLKGKIPEAIYLKRLIAEGKIKEITATAAEIMAVQAVFDRVFIQGLQEGELEALALIKADRVKDALFCTGDGTAIRALAMIRHFESGISMESLLRKTGLQKPLRKQFTERFFREVLTEGKQNLITGRGISRRKSSG